MGEAKEVLHGGICSASVACSPPPEALATLMYLDQQLGTDHAQRFLTDDGPWKRWPGSADISLPDLQSTVRAEVTFAAGGNPAIRRTAKNQRR
ncbi:hypothetical protein E0H75_40070 [Kribbella capetownensis]|uniref:Uncharacterized protein n=1 Tax=Kribbella capetownensis TaxID=1572659 RepID=A0A4R0J087_9ACTN|nr:DUF6000 family protein [Kribbella capetownensis]TCC39179.1 hypothetical protein E0H75_40070 [Kribbella capetownensis]